MRRMDQVEKDDNQVKSGGGGEQRKGEGFLSKSIKRKKLEVWGYACICS